MQRTVSDLYPLLAFLLPALRGASKGFEAAMQAPVDAGMQAPLLQLAVALMLRREHRDVPDELQLPPRANKRVGLRFNGLEQYVYNRVKEACGNVFQEVRNGMREGNNGPRG